MKTISSHQRPSPLRVRGFSLLEILIVVAVLAILATLLFPALRSAQERADSAVCLGNLRHIHIAMMAMANDDNGQLPLATDFANDNASWAWYLLKGDYLPKLPKTAGKRPRHPLYDPGSKVMEISYSTGAYGINRSLVDPTPAQPGKTKIFNVSHPGKKFLLMCSGVYGIVLSQATTSSLPYLYLPGRSVNRSGGWSDTYRRDAVEGRHGRKINTISLSGNAETWNADEIPLTADRWSR